MHLKFGMRWSCCSVIFMTVWNSHENILLWWPEYIFRGVVPSWNAFHDGDSHKILNSHEIHSMTVTLTKFIPWRWLSQNTKFSRNSFHDGDSHEIHSMTVTLTKCLTLTKLIRDGYLSWNTTRNPHENTYANLEATLFSWGWPSRTPVRKIIRGGQLSWKWDFHVSIIVRVFAWRCTLMNYFRESKSIFRDVICTLTKSLDSGSVLSRWCLDLPNGFLLLVDLSGPI